jgi:hypothetical protein
MSLLAAISTPDLLKWNHWVSQSTDTWDQSCIQKLKQMQTKKCGELDRRLIRKGYMLTQHTFHFQGPSQRPHCECPPEIVLVKDTDTDTDTCHDSEVTRECDDNKNHWHPLPNEDSDDGWTGPVRVLELAPLQATQVFAGLQPAISHWTRGMQR